MDDVDGYRNPVIAGFHPDPSVCRVGSQYVLATSTFTYAPGVAILTSPNLVDWVHVGNALERPSQLDLDGTELYSSLGVFAPTLRHHDGRFWMITTGFTMKRASNLIVTAEHPAGPWSEPVVVDVPGIDPDLAWDAGGSCFVHSANFGTIVRSRIDDATGEVLDGPTPTWSGTGLQHPEAPHLYEIDGTWYLMIAEGGTERGHGVSIARGPSPTGPWESCPANPILSHRSTDRPIQNTGHADLVQASDGSWWMVLLGVRPRGMSPGFFVLGRETFLAPVRWVDGWPVVDPVELEVGTRPPGPTSAPTSPSRDDFDGSQLDPRWLSVRRWPVEVASLDTRPGWLTVHGGDGTLDDPRPAFVGRRQQHERSLTTTWVDLGSAEEAGLAVRMDEAAHYEVALTVESVVVRGRIGPVSSTLAEVPRPADAVELFVETVDGVFGPDQLRLGHRGPDGAPVVLAELDGRYLSTESASGMIGRVIGMYAIGGDASFDWFDHVAVEPSS